MKHTPLPWKIRKQDIYDANGMYVATWSGTVKNAEFICRACNSHYDLLEAAKLVEGMFSVWLLDTHRSPITMKVGIDKLRKATAKAEGKE